MARTIKFPDASIGKLNAADDEPHRLRHPYRHGSAFGSGLSGHKRYACHASTADGQSRKFKLGPGGARERRRWLGATQWRYGAEYSRVSGPKITNERVRLR